MCCIDFLTSTWEILLDHTLVIDIIFKYIVIMISFKKKYTDVAEYLTDNVF